MTVFILFQKIILDVIWRKNRRESKSTQRCELGGP